MRGSHAKEARKKRAIERLEKHLADHRKNHEVPVFVGQMNEFLPTARFADDKVWQAHDKAQRAELTRLKKI